MVRLVDDIQIEPFVIFGISSPVSSLLIHDLCFLVILVIDYVVCTYTKGYILLNVNIIFINILFLLHYIIMNSWNKFENFS